MRGVGLAVRERGEGRQLGLEREFGSEELADRAVHGCECGLG